MEKKPYVSNRYDCVEFVMERLGVKIARRILPEHWFYENNFMIQDICELLSKDLGLRIKTVIFNAKKLEKDDLVVMRLRGKFAHHLAIYIGNGHIEHCIPGVGITKAMIMPRFFLFGVRLWE